MSVLVMRIIGMTKWQVLPGALLNIDRR